MAFGWYLPGQQILHCLGICQIRSIRSSQQPGQISVGIQAVLNGCLDQAEHNCAAGGALGGIGEQEVRDYPKICVNLLNGVE